MDKNYTYINDELLAKYLLGEATMAEKQQVKEWASSSPEHLKQLEDFKAILEASKREIDLNIDVQQSLRKLNARINRNAKTKYFNYRPVLRWAAILILLSSGSLFVYHNTTGSKINANTLEHTLIQSLPDGSTATLNKHSSIAYVGGFFNKTRRVKLTGEAFFNITSNKKKPFIIDVNDVKVTVVGTAFNVKNDGHETIVSVENGIVEVENNNKRVRITAGEKVEIKNNQLLKGQTHGMLYKFYYSNVLVCDNTPLDQLVEVLNKKFDVDIVIVNQEIKDLPISTTFENNSLKDILRIVAETLRIEVSYEQRIIKLK